jgi:hypothetical protein
VDCRKSLCSQKVKISQREKRPFFLPRNICLCQRDNSSLTSVHTKIFALGQQKAIKPDFQPDKTDHQFPGPAAWAHVTFPFSSLQIKLVCLLFLFQCGTRTLTTLKFLCITTSRHFTSLASCKPLPF